MASSLWGRPSNRQFIGLAEGLLEIELTDDQPNIFGGNSVALAQMVSQSDVKACSVDLVGEDDERMFEIESCREGVWQRPS